MGRSHIKDVPADFAAVAPTMSGRELIKHYCTGGRVMRRWLAETGITAGKTITKKRGFMQPPADFADTAPTMAQRALAAHYGVARDTISRWCKQIGVARTRAPRPKQYGQMIFRNHPGTQIKHEDLRSRTMFDDAADVIRRRMPVFPCNERGLFAEKNGTHWRVGNVVVTPDELLERADRYRRRAA